MARERLIHGILIRENLDKTIEILTPPAEGEGNERDYYICCDDDGNIIRQGEVLRHEQNPENTLNDLRRRNVDLHYYFLNIVEYYDLYDAYSKWCDDTEKGIVRDRPKDEKYLKGERKISARMKNGKIIREV